MTITDDYTPSDEEGSDVEEESADSIVIGIGKTLKSACHWCDYLFWQQNCGGVSLNGVECSVGTVMLSHIGLTYMMKLSS